MSYTKHLLLTILFITFSLGLSAQAYLNESLPIHQRVADLLNQLTIYEKITLLRATSPGIPRFDIPKYYHGNEALHGVARPGRFTVFTLTNTGRMAGDEVAQLYVQMPGREGEVMPAGTYTFMEGASSSDIRLKTTVTL